MKTVKVLGSGCKKCIKAAELVEAVALELGVEVNIEKESSPEAMLAYGVMSTPAIVIDETLVHSGSIPGRESVVNWLNG